MTVREAIVQVMMSRGKLRAQAEHLVAAFEWTSPWHAANMRLDAEAQPGEAERLAAFFALCDELGGEQVKRLYIEAERRARRAMGNN